MAGPVRHQANKHGAATGKAPRAPQPVSPSQIGWAGKANLHLNMPVRGEQRARRMHRG